MTFEDLDEFFVSDLPLPIGGKTYRIPSPSADVGLHCQLIADIGHRQSTGLPVSEDDVAMLRLDDDEEQQFYRRVLGPAFDEMAADEVAWSKIRHAAQTSFTWIVRGKAAAERVWREGEGQPARPAPQDRLKKKAKK